MSNATSSRGLDFLSKWEGCILHVYLDCVGIPTVGVGHVVLPGEDNFSAGITKEQALELLSKDVSKCERAIAQYIHVPLTQNQYDALVSWSFNCGVGVLRTSTLAKLLNSGDYQGAADEFPKWCKAGGKTNQGLLNRRNAERELFLREDA